MKKIFFVGENYSGSNNLRGVQISQALKKHFDFDVPYVLKEHFLLNEFSSIKDSIIIFVGEPLFYCGNADNIKLLNKNNVLIYDVIDNFCFEHTNPFINTDKLLNAYQYLDVIIHTNKTSKNQLEELLNNVKHIVIPHQWDFRNEDIEIPNLININKAAYIGTVRSGFQLDYNSVNQYVDVYKDPLDINNNHLKYNIQVSFRKNNTLDFIYKPCTKLAMSSTFGSILLTSRDISVVDVVGDSYEFYIDSEQDLIDKMNLIREMSESKINHYRDNALAIKDYLSPKQTAKRYIDLLNNYI